jgi:transcriptional regulator of heat shock response
MKVILENTTQCANRVWTSKVEPSNLLSLSNKPIHQKGSLSVLMVENPNFDKVNGTLQFNIESLVLLNLGNSLEAIIIDSKNVESTSKDSKIIKSPSQKISSGDDSFLKELDKLPSRQKEIGELLLSGVRNEFFGELKHISKTGKFIETPDDYWAIQIQPKAKNFRIIIYGSPHVHHGNNKIELKQDTSFYSSFILSSKAQIEGAVCAIEHAKYLRRDRRSG